MARSNSDSNCLFIDTSPLSAALILPLEELYQDAVGISDEHLLPPAYLARPYFILHSLGMQFAYPFVNVVDLESKMVRPLAVSVFRAIRAVTCIPVEFKKLARVSAFQRYDPALRGFSPFPFVCNRHVQHSGVEVD